MTEQTLEHRVTQLEFDLKNIKERIEHESERQYDLHDKTIKTIAKLVEVVNKRLRG